MLDARGSSNQEDWTKDGEHDSFLFNLGNPEACRWMSRYIGDFIEQNGIDYYRQDFNIEPEGFWYANDKPGRQGICEIRYIEGLYAFWDYLLQRFPHLLIDNCASGGRRLDLETTSRSAAAAKLVITPMRCGFSGSRCLRSGANKPSASSFFFNRS